MTEGILDPDGTAWPVVAGTVRRFHAPQVLRPVSPVDGRPLAPVVVTPPEVVADAVEAVSRHWSRDRHALRQAGPDVAERIATLLRERADEGADHITYEMGKPRFDESRLEVLKAADFFDWAARRMRDEGAVDVRRDGRRLATIERRGAGVVASITPWNFPVSIPAEYLAAAVAAGCGVVWKPSEQVPATSAWLLSLMLDAGLPAEAIAMVTGPGLPTGDALFAHPSVDCLCFTGSTRAGQHLARHVGLRRRIFELGGNCPVLVADVADLGALAAELAWGATSNAGQRCNSVERVIVTPRVSVPELVSALAAALAALRVASPWQRGTAVGPLATAASADRVRAELAGATRRDALVIGAPAGAGLGDCYVAPTLVTGVAPDMDLFRQETFGPVLSVTEVAGLDAAIAAANATEYGLYGSVFTDDAEVLRRCAAAMNVSVLVHNAAPGRWDASLPVGGAVRTASGVGRVGGAYALDEVAETHSTQW